MQWSSWSEQEGELSARERRIIDVAFKISNNLSLKETESVEQLVELPDEDVFAVIKAVALFTYWQQLVDAHAQTSKATLRNEGNSSVFDTPPNRQSVDPSPYFYEGNPPSSPKAKPSERLVSNRNGFNSHR